MQSFASIDNPLMLEIRDLAARADARVLVMAGLSFRCAGIHVREKLAFNAHDLPGVLRAIGAHPAIEEVLLLSTCNRTELYILGDRDADWGALLPSLLAEHSRADARELANCLCIREGEDAARHLFRVTAGLDSMVIGECEIVQQLKRAILTAREAGTAGTILQRLAEKALAASKQARTQVRYDECGLSVASLAVSACKRFFHDDLRDRTVLVLGAGETAELTLHYLVNKGVKQVCIANRTLERAEQLARLTGGIACTLNEFPAQLAHTDLVISCTASPQPLITREMLEPVMAAHPEKRLLLIDLAVPRDVDADVATLPGVRLLNVDTLESNPTELAGKRVQKILDAERIVADEAHEFAVWQRSRRTVAVLQALQTRIEQVREDAAASMRHELDLTPEQCRRVIDPQTQLLVEGIVREALGAMQQVLGNDDASYQMQLARKFLEQCAIEK